MANQLKTVIYHDRPSGKMQGDSPFPLASMVVTHFENNQKKTSAAMCDTLDPETLRSSVFHGDQI